MWIYFLGNRVLEVTLEEIIELCDLGYIKEVKGIYELNNNCEEIKYLFSPKIKLFKKLMYLRHINSKHFTCEHCGKKHSFHVSPKIDENGNVNFKEIVCVCKSCRTNKLDKKDILVPHFKQKINWYEENNKIREEIKNKNISSENENEYFKKRVKQIKLTKFVKLVLPPLYEENVQNKTKEEFELKNLLTKLRIDTNDYEHRSKLRKFLYLESNGFCPVCGNKLEEEEMSIDHIVARFLGGNNSLKNIIGMCHKCNKEKGHYSILEFLCSVELKKMPLRILKEAHLQQNKCKEYLKTITEEINSLS